MYNSKRVYVGEYMNMKANLTRFIKENLKLCISLILLFSFSIILFYSYVHEIKGFYEYSTQSEFPIGSPGDCQLKNVSLSIKKDVYVALLLNEKSGPSHIVATDKKIIYDNSRLYKGMKKNNDGESYVMHEKRVILIVKIDNNIYSVKYEKTFDENSKGYRLIASQKQYLNGYLFAKGLFEKFN
jgi:hypothetical protein